MIFFNIGLSYNLCTYEAKEPVCFSMSLLRYCFDDELRIIQWILPKEKEVFLVNFRIFRRI